MKSPLILLPALAFLAAANVQAVHSQEPVPKKVAIVIGITSYDESVLNEFETNDAKGDPKKSGVKYCADNAKELEGILINMGYEVRLLNTNENATSENIEKQFNDLGTREKKPETLLVIAMGHGGYFSGFDEVKDAEGNVTSPEVKPFSYVVVADSKVKDGKLSKVVSVPALRTFGLRTKADKIVTIIDACRNKVGNLTVDIDLKNEAGYYKVKSKYDANYAIFSCQEKKRSLLIDEVGGSAFSRPLISALTGRSVDSSGRLRQADLDKEITAQILYSRINTEMKKVVEKKYPPNDPKYSGTDAYTQNAEYAGQNPDVVLGLAVGGYFAKVELTKKAIADYEDALYPGANFTEATLKENVSFAGKNLFRANFSKLKNKKDEADPEYTVDFSAAELTGANFKGAALKKANFKGALLLGASFANADLRDADFTGAQGLDYVDLTGAQRDGAKGLPAGGGVQISRNQPRDLP